MINGNSNSNSRSIHGPRAAWLEGRRLWTLGIAALGVATFEAHAQVDYGALAQLFGEPVTTSATGTPQRVTQVPLNMEIITADDIRRTGADNIPDILQFVAGVDVRRYSFADADVAVRGYNQQYSPRLLVLVNGRQVYLDDYGRTAWQTIPVQIDEIRQIEVIKGPNSALFGFNAVAGVINIITYDPLTDSTNAATVRGGSHGNAAGSVVTTLHAGDTAGARLSAGAWRANEFSTRNLQPAFGPYYTSPYQFALSADSRVKLAPNVELTAEGTLARAKNLDAPPLPVLLQAGYRTHSAKLGLSADTVAGLVNLQGYLNHSAYDAEVMGADAGAIFKNNVYVAQASDQFKLGTGHTVRLGIEYRYSTVANVALSDVRYDVFAASAMWNWQLSRKLALSNSLREDRLQMHYSGAVLPSSRFTTEDYDRGRLNALSFNSGLVYSLSTDDTIRLMAARGVQAPTLIDLALFKNTPIGGGLSISYTGNPTLKAAAVMNYEVDYDRALAALGARLRIAAYYQDTRDLLTPATTVPLIPVPGGFTAFAQNVGSSSAAGGELGLKSTAATGLRWNVSYAFICIEDHLIFPTLAGSARYLDYRDGSPRNVVDIGLGYSAGPWEFDLQGRWQSRFTDYTGGVSNEVEPFRIDGRVVVNARVGYRITDPLTLSITGAQLANERVFEAAGTPVERRVIVGATASF